MNKVKLALTFFVGSAGVRKEDKRGYEIEQLIEFKDDNLYKIEYS